MSQITEYLCSQPQFSSEGLIRLFLNQCPAGWIEKDIAAELLNFSNEWTNHNGSIYIGNDNLNEQLQRAAHHLQERGLILGWRNENYGVCVEDNTGAVDFDRPVCALERATFRRFGFVSRAIHVNAYYPDGTICLGKRAHTKSIDPNRLDNMAAGGIPIYESIYDCAIRELAEEAGVPNDTAKNIQLIESIHIQRNEIDGTHNEILYCFDLALPEYFTPQNQDGEVSGFYRKNPNEVITLLPEMTWDAGRVMAEFLIRRGWK
ncbi:MAG: NUDIX hydrolase [Deefgea sp.]